MGPQEEVQRPPLSWTLPLQSSRKDLLENCPWNDPSQDRERQGCSQALQVFEGCPPPYDKKKKMVVPSALKTLRLKHGRKYCSIGRLAHEVGWKYQDIVESLEVKRKVKAEAFHQKNVALNKAKADILKDPKMVKTLAPYQAVIDSYGHK